MPQNAQALYTTGNLRPTAHTPSCTANLLQQGGHKSGGLYGSGLRRRRLDLDKRPQLPRLQGFRWRAGFTGDARRRLHLTPAAAASLACADRDSSAGGFAGCAGSGGCCGD